MRYLVEALLRGTAEQADPARHVHASGVPGLWLFGLLLVGIPGVGSATTSDGALITNVATATMLTANNKEFRVSYAATATVLVQNPCINLTKVATPTSQAAGGSVTFTLWVVNCSPSASAFNVSIIDRLPDNLAFGTGMATGTWSGAGGTGVWTEFRSPDGLSWTSGAPPVGQITPYFMRYILSNLGPGDSAFVRFGVNIL